MLTSTPNANANTGWETVVKPSKTKNPPKQLNTETPAVTWMTLTLITVAMAFPMRKAAAIAEAFMYHVGRNFVKNVGKGKNCLNFKIRTDKMNNALGFTFGSIDFNIRFNESGPQKQTKGVLDIPEGQTFESFKSTTEKLPEVTKITKSKNSNSVMATSSSEEAPVSINGNSLRPAFLSILRCNNCQMFGHSTKFCKTPRKCPHCSGPHTHSACENTQLKKCANCSGNHSAAYKGCPKYKIYAESVNNKNVATQSEYLKRCHVTGNIPNLNTDKNYNFRLIMMKFAIWQEN